MTYGAVSLISVPLKDMLYDEGCPEEITSKFKIMQRNVEKLQRLTDQLLEYDRIDKSPAGLELRKKDIVRDLSEIAENFQYTAQKNGSSISIDSYDSLPYTYDDIKFGRIMSNLLNNAIKYSPDGGSIKISAKLISGKQASLIYGSEFITDCLEVNVVLQDMCMSRTSFYMKVKALTGQSPLQFINSYRMNTAAELLKMGKYSIKEVALMVGYQERRSFTNRFKMTFGCTPTEYGCIPTESTASVRKQ